MSDQLPKNAIDAIDRLVVRAGTGEEPLAWSIILGLFDRFRANAFHAAWPDLAEKSWEQLAEEVILLRRTVNALQDDRV